MVRYCSVQYTTVGCFIGGRIMNNERRTTILVENLS